ncbi:unnamed protein product [Gongylonema pulchrum]|uniref:Uncharacterized protein n=1 Tax=Gongylonema pulchrum TaxID=637853 RepID=A0A183CWL1_9BILA|nr:unnamed protein product [Gongylonema pulchrum]
MQVHSDDFITDYSSNLGDQGQLLNEPKFAIVLVAFAYPNEAARLFGFVVPPIRSVDTDHFLDVGQFLFVALWDEVATFSIHSCGIFASRYLFHMFIRRHIGKLAEFDLAHRYLLLGRVDLTSHLDACIFPHLFSSVPDVLFIHRIVVCIAFLDIDDRSRCQDSTKQLVIFCMS